MNDKDTTERPWYCHRWPWFLMAGPFVVVIAGIVTTYLAIRSNDGLVADDYYKQGLAINQTTARDQQAARSGLQAELMAGEGGREIRVMLRGNPDVSLPELLVLRITHPTRSGIDQVLNLRRTGAGVYAGKLDRALVGRWHVSLEGELRDWRLTGEWIVERTPVLRLP